jgi:hypothetical protein
VYQVPSSQWPCLQGSFCGLISTQPGYIGYAQEPINTVQGQTYLFSASVQIFTAGVTSASCYVEFNIGNAGMYSIASLEFTTFSQDGQYHTVSGTWTASAENAYLQIAVICPNTLPGNYNVLVDNVSGILQ